MTPEDHYAAAEAHVNVAVRMADMHTDNNIGDDSKRIRHEFSHAATVAELHFRAAEVGTLLRDRTSTPAEIVPTINITSPKIDVSKIIPVQPNHLEEDGTAPAVPTMSEPVVQPTPQFADKPGRTDPRAHTLEQNWEPGAVPAVFFRCSCGDWDRTSALLDVAVAITSWRRHVEAWMTDCPF